MIQKWYIEHTQQEIRKNQVSRFLNTSMRKDWTAENVIPLGVFPIINESKPKITNIQKLEAGDLFKVGDEYHRPWIIVDRFETQKELDIFLTQEIEDKKIEKITKDKAEIKRTQEIFFNSLEEIDTYIKNYPVKDILKRVLIKLM